MRRKDYKYWVLLKWPHIIVLLLGAIQIIRDTFLALFWPPPHVTFYFFKLLFSKSSSLWCVKWVRKKVSYKALSCFLNDDFLLLEAWKSEFKNLKKFMWHFVEPPPPLECHVLFEWPLIHSFGFLKEAHLYFLISNSLGRESG